MTLGDRPDGADDPNLPTFYLEMPQRFVKG